MQNNCPRCLVVFVLLCGFFFHALGQNDDNPHGDIHWDCQVCHGNESWDELRSPLPFDHSETGFVLSGRHKTTDCLDCHQQLEFIKVGSACADCHSDVHRGQLGLDCQTCHHSSSWETEKDMRVLHSERGFPLTGVHERLDCQSCHLNDLNIEFAGTSTECVSCHLTAFNETSTPSHIESGFSTDCMVCHSTSRWQPATFLHSETAFPLTGSHIRVGCQECHGNEYTAVPSECSSCHLADYQAATSPNHIVAGFETNCEDCHSTVAWNDGSFNHDARFFPIYSGEHRGAWKDCMDCHVVANDFSRFECINCHEHRKSEMDGEHDDVRNYVYESTACLNCHPNGEEKFKRFNFLNRTGRTVF